MLDSSSGRIDFNHIDVTYSLKNIRKIKSWIREVIQGENKILSHVVINFCSDAFLLDINRKYLNHNTFTDIITFDYSGFPSVSGEIFISIDRVKENATLFKSSLKDEIHRVMVHGVLHLCGYGDKTAAQKSIMTDKEDFYLNLRSF